MLTKERAFKQQIDRVFNEAIAKGEIGPLVLGIDHHNGFETDRPYRETRNNYDGSPFTVDLAIQNRIGDSFRSTSWVCIRKGGGVGYGEVINGGIGMVLDDTKMLKDAKNQCAIGL